MSNKKITKIIGALVVIGIVACGGYSVYRNSHKVGKINKDIELTISTMPETVNPLYAKNGDEMFVSNILYKSIYGITKKIVHTEDKKTYTLILDKDLKWSNGQPINANDVVYTFNEIMNPKNNIPLRKSFIINNKPITIKKINDYEIQFNLPEQSEEFESNLGLINPVPVKMNEYNKIINDGPYMIQSEEKGKDIILVKNPYFKDNKSKVEKITINVDKKEDSGVIDMLSFNLNNKSLDNINIRKAISDALDRNDLIASKYNNSRYVERANSIFAPKTDYYTSNVVVYNNDINKAKELIKESNEKDLNLNLIYESDAKNSGNEALAVKYELSQIGINIKLIPLDKETFNKEISNPKSLEYDLVLNQYSMGTNPNEYESIVTTSGTKNISGFSNKDIDKLFKDAENTKDLKEKEKIYSEIQMKISQEIIVYPIAYERDIDSIINNFKILGKNQTGI